jgi:hypothetical protein
MGLASVVGDLTVILVRWVVFLIYVPLRAVYRRWGWSGGRVPPETFSLADEIGGQGVLAIDMLFFRHLGAVMRISGKSKKELLATIHQRIPRLQDADPNRAWNYRSAMINLSAVHWPPEASQHLLLELKEEWVASPEDAQNWATLSPAAQRSYVRQGRLTQDAYARGMNAG